MGDMNKLNQESEYLLNSLYQEGKERWIKVLIKDRALCMKAFPFGKDNELPGYAVMAITVKDEFAPQVSAIADLEDDIFGLLITMDLDEYNFEKIRQIFKSKKAELKERLVLEKAQG